jgi:hypothetical protein
LLSWIQHVTVTVVHGHSFGFRLLICNRLQALFHELVREEDASEPEAVLRDVMQTVQRHRRGSVAALDGMGKAVRSDALAAVVATAMRQTRLRKVTNWTRVSSPVMCAHVVQSSHPCTVGEEAFHVIHFPGVPFIRLTFSKETSTAYGLDFVTIFTDEVRSSSEGDSGA